jgi:hypothetical protein
LIAELRGCSVAELLGAGQPLRVTLSSMPCDHLGPPDVIELAERDLRARGVDVAQWNGIVYRHGENTPGGMWGSVVIEVERRDGEWMVIRLDRNRDALAEEQTGLQRI